MITEKILLERAHAMRRNPTEWEKRLWRHLSNSQLGGFKFRRQAVIAPYICDFLCPARALVVEIDGDTHDAQRDVERDDRLVDQGYTVVRFSNADVATNMDGVLQVILNSLHILDDRWPGQPHPNPSPEGEGLNIEASRPAQC